MNRICQLLILTLLSVCLACAHSKLPPLATDQAVKGIRTGLPALPYFVYSKFSLQRINDEFKNANAAVTIEDTYSAAYQIAFEDVPPDGNTGQAFTNMEIASRYLQNILKSKGVTDFQTYLVTAITAPNDEEFILIAAVDRPDGSISVFNKFDFLLRQTLSPKDLAYFRAYRTDVDHNLLDTVYEWAALPTDCIANQANQAIFLTLIANKILEQKADNDYWREERQWIAGNHLSVLIKQDLQVSKALGIEKGFTQLHEIYNQ